MKLMSMNALLTFALSVVPCSVGAEGEAPDQKIQEARSLVKTFGSELKSVLTAAMKSGGPIKALEVCNLQARAISDIISSSSGWEISRTSTKVRNEKNTPDEWESGVMRQFEKRKAAGDDLKVMEYYEVVKDGEKSVFRYMKPIPTAGLCLTCHGENIAEQITEKVTLLYPNDRATGFNVGDIRGAFSLQRISK